MTELLLQDDNHAPAFELSVPSRSGLRRRLKLTAKMQQLIKEARSGTSPLEGPVTIYLEIRLDGSVHVYEMTDARLLLKAGIETRGAFLPPPRTVEEAHEYLRSNAYHLEMFETREHFRTWAEAYSGYQAETMRTAFRRHEMRRATHSGAELPMPHEWAAAA